MSKSTLAIIVSPKVLLREGIASLLQNSCYKVVGLAARTAELPPLARCPKEQPALAILGMDWQSGNPDDAAENIRLLRTLLPYGKVVLVIESNAPIDLERVLALVSDGCVFNLGSRDILIKVLELAFMDQRVLVFNKSIAASSPLDSFRLGPLSSREREILRHLAKGKSNKVIARLCKIAEPTVKVHLRAILRKTNMPNRTQAAIWAIEHGVRDSILKDNADKPEHHVKTATDAPSLSPTEPPTGSRPSRLINGRAHS